MTRRKPTPGHKLVRVQCFFEAQCECGWRSGMYGTTGARAGALEEWRSHVSSCVGSEATPSRQSNGGGE